MNFVKGACRNVTGNLNREIQMNPNPESPAKDNSPDIFRRIPAKADEAVRRLMNTLKVDGLTRALTRQP